MIGGNIGTFSTIKQHKEIKILSLSSIFLLDIIVSFVHGDHVFFVLFLLETPGIPEMDICFAMSTFDLDGEKTFKKMQEAVKSIIEKHKDYDQIRYSILPFGTEPSSVREFGEQFDSLDKLMENVMSIPRPRGRPDVVKALKRAEELFENAPPRPRAKKFLVVFVGSKSGNAAEMLKKAAKPLEDKTIKVISVAVGTESDPTELIKIVPNKGNLIKADKIYEDPDKLGDVVMETVLKGEEFGIISFENTRLFIRAHIQVLAHPLFSLTVFLETL